MANITQKPLSGDTSIDGLLKDGWKWSDPVITFAFPTSLENGGYDLAISGFRAFDTWSTTDPYVLGANEAFSEIRNFTKLDVLEMQGGDSLAKADIKIAYARGIDWNRDGDLNDTNKAGQTELFSNDGTLGLTVSPFTKNGRDDAQIFVDPIPNDPLDPRYKGEIMLHEIGHALGLKHPWETTDAGTGPLASGLQNWEYTLMAYGSGDAPSTYMQLDIQALQYLYGANYDYNSTDTTYRWDPLTGEMFINGWGEGGLRDGKIFMTIWDGGGNDTYDFSNYTTDVTIDLNPGASSVASAAQLANYDGTTAKGNIYNARLFEGDERSLIENAMGGSGDDKITGNAAANVLTGGDGNDELHAVGGNDTMVGGIGDDTYFISGEGDKIIENVFEWSNGRWVSGGNDTVRTTLSSYTLDDPALENLTIGLQPLGKELSGAEFTGTGNDLENVLQGRASRETLYGLGGNDILDGGRNADTMVGGTGNDTYYVDNEGDVVDETLFVGSGGRGLTLGYSGYVDAGDPGDTVMTTLSSYDLSNIGSNNITARALVPQTLYGIIENLTYIGADRFTGIGNDANNIITGGALGDNLSGGVGSDTLIGGAGNDGMDLGLGDDKAFIDNGTAEGGDVVVGGGGFDSVYADDSTIAGGLHLNVFRAGTAFSPDVNEVAFTSAAIDVDYIEGNAGRDVIDASRLDERIEIHGMKGSDIIIGGAAGDILDGGDDADIITGGAGNDVIQLGAGSDTAIIDNGTAEGGDVVVGGGGFDTVYADDTTIASGLRLNLFRAGTGYTPDVNQVALTSAAIDIDAVIGNDGDDVVDASRLDTTDSMAVLGGKGDDTFISGASADRFDGGDDFDSIVYRAPVSNYKFELIDEGPGNPIIKITDVFTGVEDLVKNVERAVFEWEGSKTSVDLTQLGTAASGLTFDGTASWGSTVLGGAGIDTVTYETATSAIYVDLSREGGYASGAPGQVEHLSSIENLTGATDYMNYLHGDQNDNILIGGDMPDWLTGRGGNNILDGRGGLDLADYLETNAPVNIDLSIGKAVHSTGTDTLISIENVRGTNWDDTFIGDGQANYFHGMNGNDTAYGGGGNDELIGSGDADILHGDQGDDLLVGEEGADTLDGGDGFDTASYASSPSGVTVYLDTGTGYGGDAQGDHLTGIEGVIGSAFNDNIVGSARDEVLEGGDGNDSLTSGGGADTLLGGAGDDVLSVDNMTAHVDGGTGWDVIFADASTDAAGFDFTVLGTNVEYVIGHNGNDVIDARGLDYAITISTSDGNDTVLGGSGGIAVFAGAGEDTILGGDGFDQLLGGDGNDVMNGGGAPNSPWGDRLFGEGGDDTLTGTGNGWVIGGADNDTIFGAANDYLTGDEGNDIITGGAGFQQIVGGIGNDIMTGGADADRFDFEKAFGNDIITDFDAGSATNDVIKLSLGPAFDTFAEVMGAATQVGDDVVFDFGQGDQLTLKDTAITSLAERDFLLA